MLDEPPTVSFAGIGDEAAVALNHQITAIRALGWSAIELRTVDGIALAELDSQQFSRVSNAVRDADLDVVCLDSRIGNWARPITSPFVDDLRELDILAERCAALGTRFVRIMSYPNDGLPENEWGNRALDRIHRLTERAALLDIVLLHENCSGWAGSDLTRMLRLVTEVGGRSLRLLFDTGNGIEHGYNAVDVLRGILPHVAHVHVKDAAGTAGNARYVLPGDGQSRVADCVRLLLAHGYRGALSLEPHLAVRPHDGVCADDDAAELFTKAGRRLELLVRKAVHPTANGEPAAFTSTGTHSREAS